MQQCLMYVSVILFLLAMASVLLAITTIVLQLSVVQRSKPTYSISEELVLYTDFSF